MDADGRTNECANLRWLQAQVVVVQRDVERLAAEVAKLTVALEEARCGGKRQAAQFHETERPKPKPKNPGRKGGRRHGAHAHRAASSQLGPLAHAAMAVLNRELGLSHGKITRLFGELFGVRIAGATSVQSILRSARRYHHAYTTIRQEVRSLP